MKLGPDFHKDAESIRHVAMQSMFELLEGLCEGTLVVDRDARIVWMSEKYAAKLGLNGAAETLGREVEQVIPSSLMREVLRTGKPILLDIMQFGNESFVVTRIPLRDESGEVIGAIGFALYDRLHYLKPLVSKFSRLQNALASAEKKLAEERSAKYTFSSFVGSSPACLEVKRQARRAAQLDATVLLLGETGTGKELLAQAIHAAGPRAHKPFVGVNVAAIPETLMEAEFFGAASGAYSGADKRGREGKFKLADGGTLFLDEIGDMPLPLQAKLLRVLQEQEFEPLGSNEMVKVDVRIIAATSIDLQKLVAEGRFRADLYYRLNVLTLSVPPLRERLADLDALSEHVLDQIARRSGMPVREIAPDAIELLRSHDWPGNIRELRNVLERATMLTDDVRLALDDFVSILRIPLREAESSEPVRRYDDALAEFERRVIREALQSTGGKVPEAAKLLGLGRATLYKKLVSLGISTR
ncbi:MAG: sigma-54-dependent Fis family transcriptional regulator [Rhodocyclaceae bacterium]|nr:sigma-54-dependent Fis family transcriptional regulator [Rhodocyclaceae bacterium]